MPFKPKKLLRSLSRFLLGILVLVCAYLLVVTGIVVWTFEVKLQRWPLFVHTAPFVLRVGDDIDRVGLMERLKRLGYVKCPDLIPGPGQWTRSGSGLRIFLVHCALKGQGIVSGPVQISLDWKRVLSIKLLRSLEQVDRIVLAPELLDIIPGRGSSPALCRRLPLEEINSVLVDAIRLTEDARFFSHKGIDLVSIRHALKTNIKAGRYVRGGSTITQQLIRMVLLSPEKTLVRKFNEIFLAVAADAVYSKETILEAYLNRVYFGHWGTYPVKGVGEAARLFFGGNQAVLNSAQCALLAAVIKAPNIINPYRHPARARSRRNMILGLLLKAGKISREEYDYAKRLPVRMRRSGAPPVRAGAFVALVNDYLNGTGGGIYGGPEPQDVLTSLDPLDQRTATLTLGRLGRPGALAHLVLVNPETGMISAFIAPGSGKWSGEGWGLEPLLPLVVIPALTPDAKGRVKYTLASRVLFPGGTGPATTFRDAFYHRRPLLTEKLIAETGPTGITSIMKEFGVRSHLDKDQNIVVDPLTPMEMAQVYSMLATLGNAGEVRPGIKIVNGDSTLRPPKRRRVSVSPAVLFLVNYLLKPVESLTMSDGRPVRSGAVPSLFAASDKAGTWSAAYRRDMLLLVRMPGNRFKGTGIIRMMARHLPGADFRSQISSFTPESVVFRKTCVESGQRATSLCPSVISEPFLKGTKPVEWCPLRHD